MVTDTDPPALPGEEHRWTFVGDTFAIDDTGRAWCWAGHAIGWLRDRAVDTYAVQILGARKRATAEASVRVAALRFLAAKAEKGEAMMLGGDVIACHNAAMAAARALRDACAALTAAGGVVDEATAEVLRETEAKS